jgi:serine/threonine-protein kinase
MAGNAVTNSTEGTSLEPGAVIAGKYRLERQIGRGAMGTVWRAQHVSLGQRVAIKIITREKAQSPEARKRFSIEAKAAARLRSRFAVQVYDDGETADGMPFIVLEYLEGETLEQRIIQDGRLALPLAVKITTHIGRALSRAHAEGIVHRDLKPANVFLSVSQDEPGFVAKVLDFGIAKLLDDTDPATTQAGMVLGTPLFMSPEQVRRASTVDQRADLYSLGMLFYNMVTGQRPFDAQAAGDVLAAICMDPLPDILEANPDLPVGLRAFFWKACARNPAARFQNADAMIEALEAATSTAASVSEGTFTKSEVPERSFAFNRWTVQLLVFLVAAVGITIGIIKFAGSRRGAEPQAPDREKIARTPAAPPAPPAPPPTASSSANITPKSDVVPPPPASGSASAKSVASGKKPQRVSPATSGRTPARGTNVPRVHDVGF